MDRSSHGHGWLPLLKCGANTSTPVVTVLSITVTSSLTSSSHSCLDSHKKNATSVEE